MLRGSNIYWRSRSCSPAAPGRACRPQRACAAALCGGLVLCRCTAPSQICITNNVSKLLHMMRHDRRHDCSTDTRSTRSGEDARRRASSAFVVRKHRASCLSPAASSSATLFSSSRTRCWAACSSAMIRLLQTAEPCEPELGPLYNARKSAADTSFGVQTMGCIAFKDMPGHGN